jgi:xylulokinase
MSFLSIDVGSSRCKAALFSSSGEMLGMRSAVFVPDFPRPGYAELNANNFLAVVIALAQELTALPQAEPVQAVCLSSHGETLIPATADGQALGPAILNLDGRATREARWIEEQTGRRQLFMLTGHTSHPMYTTPKVLWLRRNAREVFEGASRFLSVTSFLLMQLGLPPLVDYSHAARFMALDVHRLAWSAEILSTVEISPDALPIPVQAGTLAGVLDSTAAAMLGVVVGTPVVVGGHDQVIGAIGLGVIAKGRAAGSLGSYECITVASDELHLNDAALQASLNCYPHAVPGQYVTIAYFPGGIMMQWLGEILYGAKRETGQDDRLFADLELGAPTGPTELVITPHLIGTCNPEFDSQARGAITGLSFDTTRAHLYKGIQEGIASELSILTRCLEDAGCSFGDINVFGGGVRSPLGMLLRASLTKKRLHIMSCQEAVCLGGAMLASVAVGTYRDLGEAARAMVREQDCVHPDPLLAAQYRSQVERYRQLRSMLVQPYHQEHQHTGEQA